MLDRAILHLTLMVESIDAIHNYIAGLDREAFLRDRLVQDAVAMNFQVIGEAARKLTAAERAEAPEIPWSQVVSLRNRIAHDYRTAKWDLAWEIVENEFESLRSAARRMLAARGE